MYFLKNYFDVIVFSIFVTYTIIISAATNPSAKLCFVAVGRLVSHVCSDL